MVMVSPLPSNKRKLRLNTEEMPPKPPSAGARAETSAD